MKTPVKELFDKLWDTPKDKFTWYAILRQILEKEKEVITEAFLDGKLDGWQNQWAHPNDYYNETFNTKEK
jgi:hypothetical protein